MEQPKIPIVGIGPDGLAGLSARSVAWLNSAEIVFGSEAALTLLPELTAERVRIGTDLPEVVEKLKASLGKKRMAVAAVGDPLFYGTARYLCEKVGPDQFEVVPHVSSMQLAFARLKETWEEAYLTDLSAKALDDVLDKIRIAETVGLFTSDRGRDPLNERGLGRGPRLPRAHPVRAWPAHQPLRPLPFLELAHRRRQLRLLRWERAVDPVRCGQRPIGFGNPRRRRSCGPSGLTLP